MKKNISFLILAILVIFSSCISAVPINFDSQQDDFQKIDSQQYDFKKIQDDILNYLEQKSPGTKTLISLQLVTLKQGIEENLINFFVQESSDAIDYWTKYSLLTQLILSEGKTVTSPKMPEIKDPFYDELINNQEQYKQILDKCKEQSLQIKDQEYNYDLLEKIEQDNFYQIIEKQLPKGVIQHIHWSASADYKAIFESVKSLKDLQVEEGKQILIVTADVYVKIQNQLTEKKFSKFLLTQKQYIDTPLQDSTKEQLFKDNYIEDNKCLQSPKDAKNILNDDTFVKGYYFIKFCRGKLYSPSKADDLDSLKILIKSSMASFESDEKAINELPQQYKDNIQQDLENLKVIGIWLRFEQIFDAFNELLYNDNITESYTKYLFSVLKDQNTSGIEFRNNNYKKQIAQIQQYSDQYQVPFDYIVPGRKIAADKSKLSAIILDDAPKGIDFYGFEDDPLNNGRNFFSSSLLKDNASTPGKTYFDNLYEYLKSGKNMFLHSGETTFFPNSKQDQTYLSTHYINDNIIHAALLPGVKRVGHGFAAANSSLLLQIFQRKKITIESNPISNEVLKYFKIESNPFLNMLRSGMRVTISPDDPGLFGYTGVAQDWYQILMRTDIKPSEIYLLLKYSIEDSTIQSLKSNTATIQKVQQDLLSFFENAKKLSATQVDADLITNSQILQTAFFFILFILTF